MTSFSHDAVAYSIERIVRLVVGGATAIMVARHLGAETFGVLAFALAVFGLVLPLATLGMPNVLVRDFVTRSRWQRSYASALASQVPAAAISGATGATALIWAKGGDTDVRLIAGLLCALPMLATAATPRAWLESERAATLISMLGIGASLTSGGLRVVGIMTGRGIVWFAIANIVEAAILFIGFTVAARRRANPRPRIADANLDDARRLLGESLPLLVAGLAIAIYMTIDVVMLGILRSNDDAGIYSAAVRLSEAWYFIPLAIMSAARPRLSALLDQDRARYRTETLRVLRLLSALAYLGALITLLFARPAIAVLFGAEFESSARVLRIHVLATPFVFLGTGASQAFVDTGMTRIAMWRSIVGAAINVALNSWLIPAYGATGAAVATLISYALASVALNAVQEETRWIFKLQMRAMLPTTKAP